MVTGIELAGLILATFPIIIHALETYGDEIDTLKEWARFRLDFNGFLNDLIRQQIFFRQHIEDLLSSVIDSEYLMGWMLEDPLGIQWKDPQMEAKLKQRLSGKQEYATYMITVSATLSLLAEIQRKLKITQDKPHWSEVKGKGLSRIGFEFKRIAYILDKRRRGRLMEALEKYNKDLQQLLGNSDRLEPRRRKRKAASPKIFERFRKQASSLHDAISQSLLCDCPSIHDTKLLLPKRDRELVEAASNTIDTIEPLRLQVLFPRKLQCWSSSHVLPGPDDDWFATDIEMMDADEDDADLTARSLSHFSVDTAATLVPMDTRDFSCTGRKVTFQCEGSATTSTIPKDAIRIQDLCAALKESNTTKPHLGYIRGLDNYCHTIYPSGIPSPASDHIYDSITLGDHIRQHGCLPNMTNADSNFLCRRDRLEIALMMANILLQLFQCPWLNENWSKDDIFFFRDSQGKIFLETMSLHGVFYPKSVPSPPKAPDSAPPVNDPRSDRKLAKAALLSLGVLILELWFYKPIESCAFRKRYLGSDGNENEFTTLNTAQVWQEQAQEEGGSDFDKLTYRCIHGDFGTAKQDLNDEELKKAVYCEVVQPLEQMIARYE
ncbi:hypothetical protein P154DRAFT_585250 [Amniculicola lignicola CBS 123094]|uniref:DUF7580 domain-containing protein n=1 Tax=Amniculicola lignicola CBS 123094 TaxID=1392246 RepID=A0A6A5X267_9PLEO|nr:hypothetical protein P154DRAFT_585250 [Amniculicola lignicola CBS 123094]